MTKQLKPIKASSEKRKIIIFIGPEGSGKSTQAKTLSHKLNLPYVGTGDIIREKAENDKGSLGDACREMIKNNAYLSPSLIRQMLVDRLSKKDASNGFILDGGLRTLEETEKFDKTLQLSGKENFEINIIYLEISEELGISRRLNSKNKRGDDTEEGIRKRLKHFYTNFDERIKIIKTRYNFFQIDASKDEKSVYLGVIERLKIK